LEEIFLDGHKIVGTVTPKYKKWNISAPTFWIILKF
jgi:hypothetical protein